LLEATIAIPITVPAESVRVLEKVESEGSAEAALEVKEENKEGSSSGGDFPVPG
jgi:hypothetical protein